MIDGFTGFDQSFFESDIQIVVFEIGSVASGIVSSPVLHTGKKTLLRDMLGSFS
jgi:hypothetical protein